jgi:hypothetical protein
LSADAFGGRLEKLEFSMDTFQAFSSFLKPSQAFYFASYFFAGDE